MNFLKKIPGKFIAVIFIAALSFHSYSQDRMAYDSLLSGLKTKKADSLVILTYLEIGDIFLYNPNDTALFWYTKAKELAASKLKGEDAPLKIYRKLFAESIKSIGIYNYYNGKYDIALKQYEEALEIFISLQELTEMAKSYSNIGIIHQEQFRGDEAIVWYLKALSIFEDTKNRKGTATCKLNIGNVFSVQKKYNKAEEYYLKAFEEFVIMKNDFGIATCYNNLGGIYNEMKQYDKSMECYKKALPVKIRMDDQIGVSDIYLNMGNLYYSRNDLQNAFMYFQKSLDIGLKFDHRPVVSNAYVCIAGILIEQKKIEKGIEMALKGIQIASEDEMIEILKWGYSHLSFAYELKGDYKLAIKYKDLFVWAKDSIESRDRDRIVSELDAKYQNEKKEKQIELQKADIETKKARISQQRTQLIAFIAGFILVLLLLLYAWYNYRLKKKANILLAEQKNEIERKNEELNQKNEEILAQRDEIEAQRDQILERNEELNQKNEEIETQRDEIEIQKQLLENKNREVMDSIYYAKRIQNAILPDFRIFDKLISEYFILFKPKDVVSGDFFWFARRNNWLLFAVADCTGHGVPGAFMSMLGISFLNEINAHADITTAASVLDNLRDSIISSLKQEHSKSQNQSESFSIVKDGMDIAFCALNTETLELQFAGANNPLWIIKSPQPTVSARGGQSESLQDLRLPTGDSKAIDSVLPTDSASGGLPTFELIEIKGDSSPDSFTTKDKNLIEIKGDKQPIGIYENMKPFTNKVIQLQKGDSIYLMSDGFQDQFGGTKGKKFMAKNLRNVLLLNSTKSLAEQKSILENALSEWMGISKDNHNNYHQVDDMTIMGLRI